MTIERKQDIMVFQWFLAVIVVPLATWSLTWTLVAVTIAAVLTAIEAFAWLHPGRRPK
jgi:hypothetical protein